MIADVGYGADRHDLAGGGGTATANAAHQAVAPRDLDQQHPRGLGNVGVIGVANDRRERAVDVQQHCGAAGIGANRLERLHERGSG